MGKQRGGIRRITARGEEVRSELECNAANYLAENNIPYAYEETTLKYTVPSRTATYTPDFKLPGNMYIETKGYLDRDNQNTILLIKQQYPDLDLRMVFKVDNVISGRKKLRYSEWCAKHNIPCHVDRTGKIPAEWLEEIRQRESD